MQPSAVSAGRIDPLIGQEVVGYRVARLIGRGGMGAVYEAVHETIGQRAAVKVLFEEACSDDNAVRRFLDGMRAAWRPRGAGRGQAAGRAREWPAGDRAGRFEKRREPQNL